MPIITRLVSRRQGRHVLVYLDNQKLVILPTTDVVRLGLKKGSRLSPSQVSTAKRAVRFERLYQKALNLLSYRPRSEKEIRSRLKAGQKTVNQVIAKLKKQNLQSDYQFASWFVDQRLTYRPKGPAALQSELAKKGLSPDLVHQILQEKLGPQTRFNAAVQALSAKKPWFRLSPPEFKKKAYSFLARRGFDSQTILQAIDELRTKGV